MDPAGISAGGLVGRSVFVLVVAGGVTVDVVVPVVLLLVQPVSATATMAIVVNLVRRDMACPFTVAAEVDSARCFGTCWLGRIVPVMERVCKLFAKA